MGTPSPTERLKAAGYVPPQKVPFKCGTCDWFDRTTGFCAHEKIQTVVEAKACCDYWEHDGVGNSGNLT